MNQSQNPFPICPELTTDFSEQSHGDGTRTRMWSFTDDDVAAKNCKLSGRRSTWVKAVSWTSRGPRWTPTLLVLCEILVSQYLSMSIHANHVKAIHGKANPFPHCITGFGPLEPSAQRFSYNNGAHLWTLSMHHALWYLLCRWQSSQLSCVGGIKLILLMKKLREAVFRPESHIT